METKLTLHLQVEELRERMRLLQGDRRANVSLLETHKKMNVSEVNNLRVENKDLRSRFATLKIQDGRGEMGTEAEVDGMKKAVIGKVSECGGWSHAQLKLRLELATS